MGKVSGILRRKYYREEIERIVASHSSTLQGLISSRDSRDAEASRTTVTDLRKRLAQECSKRSKTSAAESMNEDTEDTVFETKFIENFDIRPNFLTGSNVLLLRKVRLTCSILGENPLVIPKSKL